MKPLIALHVHSYYSLLDGVSSPAEIVARAKELGAPAVALTDHGTVSGLFEFYWAAKDAGIQPLLGCELYFKENLGVNEKGRKYFHGIFIAQNEKGFRNLLKLSSLGYTEGHQGHGRPIVSIQEIFDHSDGLVFSIACMLGIIGVTQGARGEKLTFEEADRLFSMFNEKFAGKMFVEIGPARVSHNFDSKKRCHFIRPVEKCEFGELSFETNCLQEETNRRALYMAKRHNLPVIVTSDAHMVTPDLKPVQDLLISNVSKTGFHFFQTHSMASTEDTWKEMLTNHPYISGEIFNDAVDNTYKLLSLCENFDLTFSPMVPEFPLAEHRLYLPGMTARDLAFAIIREKGRIPNNDVYFKRLQTELSVICDNGVVNYLDYFLILSDVVEHAKSIGVTAGAGRGSGAGCLLAYLLGITAIDPIKYDLSFERFLNAGRIKAGHYPDLDLDFSDREPIVRYIFDKYGVDHVAAVGSFQTIKTKNALRDIVRFREGGHLDNAHPINDITKTIPVAQQLFPSERDFLKGWEDDDGIAHNGHLQGNPILSKYLEKNPQIEKMLWQILEKPRAASQHASGIVITPQPIDTCVPTRYYDGRKCTQVNFKTLEKLGGLKIDILGINTLNFISSALKYIEQRTGVILDPWNLTEDVRVFDMLTGGETATVFQFDTDSVRPFLKSIKPKSIRDLAMITSVVRPGALDSVLEDGRTVAEHFVLRRQGQESVSYLDPILKPILSNSYGLVITQEQIQKIFEVVGGFTPVESDDARRAVGKKNLQVLLAIKGKLFDGAQKLHGWSLEKCEALWNSFIGAADYCFNFSHAVSYCTVSYACAYLKKHYPLEWWCAVLSYVDAEKARGYLREVGHIILPPDINCPARQWTIDGDRLRCPLTYIVSVGDKAVEAIQDAFSVGGKFTSFDDFFGRVNKTKVNKGVMIQLLLAGSFSSLPLSDGESVLDGDFEAGINHMFNLRNLGKKPEKVERVPTEYISLDRVQKLMLQTQVLPILTPDYTSLFGDVLKSIVGYIERDGVVFLQGHVLVPDFEKLSALYRMYGGIAGGAKVSMLGAVVSSKTFDYTNKKTGKLDRALKFVLQNFDKTIEMVIWPDRLGTIDQGDFQDGKLLVVYGALRESKRNPGAIDIMYAAHQKLL